MQTNSNAYNYRIYEHIIGLPDFLDSPNEALEESFDEMGFTADEAERELLKNESIYNTDCFGQKRRLYVYRY